MLLEHCLHTALHMFVFSKSLLVAHKPGESLVRSKVTCKPESCVLLGESYLSILSTGVKLCH